MHSFLLIIILLLMPVWAMSSGVVSEPDQEGAELQNRQLPLKESGETIQYRESSGVKVSFYKALIVFAVMIGLAYAVIYALKNLRLNGLRATSTKRTIEIIESRRLDTKTNAHLISVGHERYLVVQNGQSVNVTLTAFKGQLEESIDEA